MKTCKKFQNLIWLTVYNEIKPDEKKLLDDHIKNCIQCKLDYEEALKTITLLDKKIQLEPTVQQLKKDRDDLHQRLLFIKHNQQKNNWKIYFIKWFSLDFAPKYRTAITFAILLVGIFLGKFMFSFDKPLLQQSNPISLSELNNLNFKSIEQVEYDHVNQKAIIKFNTLHENVVKANIENPKIQYILAKTLLNDERLNVKLKTVNTMSMIKNINQPVFDALIQIIKEETNPAVRLKAIKLINSIPLNTQIKNIMISTLTKVLLTEENSAIRNEAINGLCKFDDTYVSASIIQAANKDTNDYLQYKATQIYKNKLERIDNN